jgi:hypothetical protein
MHEQWVGDIHISFAKRMQIKTENYIVEYSLKILIETTHRLVIFASNSQTRACDC